MGITIQEQRNFIKENLENLDNFENRKLYLTLFKKKFFKDTGSYIQVLTDRSILTTVYADHKGPKGSKYGCELVKFYSSSDTYEGVIEDFKCFSKDRQVEIEERKHFCETNLKYTRILTKGKLHIADRALSDLIKLLCYVITSVPLNDISSYKIMKTNGISDNSIFTDLIIEFPTCKKGLWEHKHKPTVVLTKYKNNNIIVKGLNHKHWSSVVRIINMTCENSKDYLVNENRYDN